MCALRSVEVTGSTLTHFSLLLGPFPLSPWLVPPFRKWEPHGGSLMRGPQAGPLLPSQGAAGPSQRMGSTEGIRLLRDLAIGGRAGAEGHTLANRLLGVPSSLQFLISPGPCPTFLQRILWVSFFFYWFFFLIPTYTMTQCVTCHTCLNGIILCALFWFGVWPSFFFFFSLLFLLCKSLLAPHVDS